LKELISEYIYGVNQYENAHNKEEEDILSIMLSEVGLSKEQVIQEAIRDWCVRNGFSFGNILSVYGVPLVSMDDVVEVRKEKDEIDFSTKKIYRIRGFKEEFEDIGTLFNPTSGSYNNLKEACKMAKIRWDTRNLITVIVWDKKKGKYRIFCEKYDLLKDISIPVWKPKL
jgi:hypothetical protein